MGLSLRMFTGDALRGLERGLDFLGIDGKDLKLHLEFEGRIKRLEQHPAVKKVEGSAFNRNGKKHYDIELRQEMTAEEIFALVARHGFPEPKVLEGTNPETQRSYIEFLYFDLRHGHPSKRIFFYQPNHNKVI